MAQSTLLITHSGDDAAKLVERAIRDRGWRAFRFDTDRFPAQLQLTVEQGTRRRPSFVLRDGRDEIELSSVRTVWYRRFYSARLPSDLDPKYVSYSRLEVRTLLSSVFAALGHARWVDPIERIHHAHHKILQLELAKAAGFRVPETIATNVPAAAKRFYARHEGRVVTKMLNAISFTDEGDEQMVFTSKVTRESLKELGGLRCCPTVFQEHVDKDVELRVAVVGKRLFVASVDSRGTDGEVDWRRSDALTYRFTPDRLPKKVERSVLRLMRSYGLTYASLDILRRPDGEHVFLEINSAGEWAWLQMVAGLPVHEALADELTSARAPRRSALG